MIFNNPQVIIPEDDLPPVGNATAVTQPLYIPPVMSSPFIFETEGLGAATQPAPYVEPIKPLSALPDLTIEPIVSYPEVEDQAMPAVADPQPDIIPVLDTQGNQVMANPYIEEILDEEETEQDVLPDVTDLSKRRKSVGVLDKLTNYIYKLIFK